MKRKLDIEFYNNLDENIKKILPLNEFLNLERKNQFNCEYYKNLIDKISEITFLNSNNYIEKIINFIQVLDLEFEKIGQILKSCSFIKDIKKYLKGI